MAEPVLAVSRVEKTFGDVKAVSDVSFHIDSGEIFALLGPNGAGKTTLVRMLMGIIEPDAGEISFQLDGDERHPASFGYLPEDRGLYPDVDVLRTLVYFGRLRGMTASDARTRATRWLERLDLGDRTRAKLQTLSKGNQQKVQFIAAVLHRPRFVTLDEPFSGLDPLNQDLFLGLIEELRSEGATILLSAHQMDLVERLVDRVFLVSHGREVLSGPVETVRSSADVGKRVRFRLSGERGVESVVALPAVREHTMTEENRLEVELETGAALGDFLAVAGDRLDVVSVESHRPTLHDVYVSKLREVAR